MTHMRNRRAARVAAVAGVGLTALAPAGQAWAWGHTGHVGISTLAVQHLPADLPAFVRSVASAQFIGELGAEPDESKTTGTVTTTTGTVRTTNTVHDAERDPGHYIDIDDSGVVIGGTVGLNALPPTREAFDTAQRTAASPAGQDQYTGGYLPYTILDGFQQVRKDFAIWRVMQVGLNAATSPADVAYFRYQLQVRQQITLRDIGYWSHFVADASQPMHVSVHFNGWGSYPNPQGYTTAPIHAPFEGSFVRSFIDFSAVNALIPDYASLGLPIEQRVPRYLAQTLAQVAPAYQAAGIGAGADLYRTAQPAEVAIVTRQLAAGATELRDEITDAWRQSEMVTVGFPLVRVSDAEAGTVQITPATFGSD